jgi:hypothetical protein
MDKFGSLVDVELSKIEYKIILDGPVHNFMTIMGNVWNHQFVEYYINMLIEGE